MQPRGDIRCNRIIHFRSKEPGDKTHPVIPGYVNINATSGNARWKGLSPMKLGPFNLQEHRVVTPWYPNGIHPGFTPVGTDLQVIPCTNMENIWQGSKVFDIDLESKIPLWIEPGSISELDVNRLIQPSFYERRRKMAYDPQPHRRALPKAKGTTVCAYWDGTLLAYLDSRLIYCELYTSLVQATPEYHELVRMRDAGTNLQILGFDGQNLPITPEAMRAACLDPTKPFGHELVLSCLLKGITPWRDIWLK